MRILSVSPLQFGIVLAFIFWVSLPVISIGQSNIKPIFCGNEIFHDLLERNYPELLDNINQTFEEAQQISRSDRSQPLDLNVIVHIVWHEDSENLDNSIIESQIEVLNRDFNRLNADSSDLRTRFKPVAGSANIHFHLASIVRVHTDQIFSVQLLDTNLLPEVKHTGSGGSDAWDPNKFINIWVCKIQPITIFGLEVGQVFGFSYPPNNLPNWPAGNGAPSPGEDGLVIDYRVFGANNPNIILIPGTSQALAVKGRTPVHEMGHYLGLRHIWGDGGLLGPNDCSQSDGIADTPFASAQSNFDCDTSKNTCPFIEAFYIQDVPDLIENYMDYSSEYCMNMFTHGQVDLMRGVLAGPRNSLVTDPSAVKYIGDLSDFLIYPNPAVDQLTIQLKDATEEINTVRILDLNGKIVLEKKENIYFGKDQINIDLQNVPPGIFFIQLAGLKNIYTSRLVISGN